MAKHKLNKPWTGPYLVVNDAQGWTIGIQRVPGGVVKWVHIDDVKACHPPPQTPNWIPDSQAASTPRSSPETLRVRIPKTIIMESTRPPCEDGDGEDNSSDSSESVQTPPVYFRGEKSPLSNSPRRHDMPPEKLTRAEQIRTAVDGSDPDGRYPGRI